MPYWIDVCGDGATPPPSALSFSTTPTIPPCLGEGNAGMCSQVADQPSAGTTFSDGDGRPVKLRGPLHIKLTIAPHRTRSATEVMNLTARGRTRRATLIVTCRRPRCPSGRMGARRGDDAARRHRTLPPRDRLTLPVRAPGHHPDRARRRIRRGRNAEQP